MAPIPNAAPPADFGSPRSSAPRSTILLLSGYLLGTTAAHACSPMMEASAFGAGAIGMIAYAVLAYHARQRQRQHARRAIESATVKLERRIDQQARVASARLFLKLHLTPPRTAPHEQYVTVVRSSHCYS